MNIDVGISACCFETGENSVSRTTVGGNDIDVGISAYAMEVVKIPTAMKWHEVKRNTEE